MPGRRASKKGKKKKRAFLRAVDDFVTSDAVAKFEVLSRICQEAKETFLDEPLDKYQCPNEQLIGIFSETHPAFALARFLLYLKTLWQPCFFPSRTNYSKLLPMNGKIRMNWQTGEDTRKL